MKYYVCILLCSVEVKERQSHIRATKLSGNSTYNRSLSVFMFWLTLICSCVPEGTQARIHFWSVHRDPRNFSHPDKFWPERWLIADGLQRSPEKIIHNAKAFIPFSSGPRKCAGKALAMQEMKVLLCHVMQRLRIQLAPDWDPDEWERMLQDKFVIKMGSLPVVVEARSFEAEIYRAEFPSLNARVC